MTNRSLDRRGRSIKRPPSRLGRLLVALRESVGHRQLEPLASKAFLQNAKKLARPGLTREQAANWIMEITGTYIASETLRRIEVGRRMSPSHGLLRAILVSYGLTPHEIDAVVADQNLNSMAGSNPHLLALWRMRNLAFGEFGPLIYNALPMDEFSSTWVESEKASLGGFKPGEISIRVEANEAFRPASFEKLAQDALRQNLVKKKSGIRGWSDNETLCLASVTETIANDVEERRSITLHFQRSWYRYNVVAKQEAGAEFRWTALQSGRFPIEPVPYLASGVGICINVICNEGRSIIIGERSDIETFRKREFDIAVVEGIRPKSDVLNDEIDIYKVAYRGLSEELGLNASENGNIADLVKQLTIFEFGCDLEFYQWNFLAFAEVNLTFDQVYRSWQKARDRKENSTLQSIEFKRSSVLEFCLNKPIWSAGMACAVRTFDYY